MVSMEKVFPPCFFDMQAHLVAHLVDEVALVGPVHGRWMYWVERYMKKLKDWVRQRAQPEGSMAAGYLMSEALFYSGGIIVAFDSNAPTAWEEAQDEAQTGLHVKGAERKRTLEPNVLRLQIHNYVLGNRPEMSTWITDYEHYVTSVNIQGPNRAMSLCQWATGRLETLLLQSGVNSILEDVQNIIKGPSVMATSHTHMHESANIFAHGIPIAERRQVPIQESSC